MFWKALFGSSHGFSLIWCWKVPPSCVSIIYLNKDAHWLLPHATSGRQLTTLQIISLMCACLPLHSSHQPAEVPAVKWDHTAGQAQHLLSGLTGEKHMHIEHADRTLTVRPTIEISFTGICLLPDAVTLVLLFAPTESQVTHKSLNFLYQIVRGDKRSQTGCLYRNRCSINWFPFRKPILVCFSSLFSPVVFYFVWDCMCSTNVCLLMQVVNLFNMFITYGDTFLPTSNSYDELYYEIVRMHQVFDNLYCMGM